VTENTSFGESNLSNLVDYYRHLHQNPNLRHIITPCFVSISIEGLNAPELDFEASEGTFEEELESENNVTETESAITKGSVNPRRPSWRKLSTTF
jgi:ferritin